MATLKEIRNRITSVNSTMQITSAMMMVSSAKLKRAQNSIQKLRPYSEKMQELLTHITSSIDEDYGSEYKDREEIKKVLLVVITSNRGLAGAFNSTVVKAVKKLIDTTYKGIQVDILTIGKKGNDLLSKTCSINENHSELWDSLNFKNTSEISEKLIDKFIQGEYDKIDLVYNSFKNVVVQLLKVEQFLPLQLDKEEISAKIHSDYIFESSKKEILEKLIPNTLKIQLYKAVLDSNAAEHGARMSAMQSATDNAKSLKNQLVISYNKARQASITNELIEIVSGAQALES
ncbi:ATP synthase F1 subunit gamma [Apibacter muscae]|uniref:ATP synthase gamma chain n=1 Tax=Apibacter muscae TaxID=2509004 RepID=A0A563DAU0_9FLAO|nr:ATP synthase F1 subunit gamma [Apibacter muscae]TWP23472.1 ATP synthase F1 subunit gamma [Apibacter muscae]TWP27428.1 ATP synthase F1 subunit gamma [Apibacter muscae]TWP28844.1 ATP synthase F1 subunit gamma [Apibacter muscae]